jgi:hypothetical protein
VEAAGERNDAIIISGGDRRRQLRPTETTMPTWRRQLKPTETIPRRRQQASAMARLSSAATGGGG